jgi:hypothetical protein
MSATVFKRFLSCEAEALAELKGIWVPERDPTALLAGNYLHSYFESTEAHQSFIDAHPEMFSTRGSTKGQLKTPYKVAESMIQTLKDDPSFQAAYQGNKEEILTGEINGVKWMGKLDCFDPARAFFLDLKTTQDLHKKYWITDEKRWGSFVEAYNYPLQMAVYQELIRQNYGTRPAPILVAVSKQEPPDKAFVAIPQDNLDEAMEQLLAAQSRVEQIIAGEVKPHRCEQCDYCRSTKHLGQIISMNDLIE